MTSFLKHLFLTFLLFLAVSSLHVRARENRAFSKVTRGEDPKETVAIPEESPAVQVEKAAKFSKEFPTAVTTTTKFRYDYNYNTNGNSRYNGGGFPSEFPGKKFYSESYDNKDSNVGIPGNYYNTNGGAYRNKEFPTMYYSNNAYKNEKYGMSDTRFLENGRYFYDVNAEKGYGAYAGIGIPVHDKYSYRASNREGNRYEDKKGMESNQDNQEGEEYVP